MTMITNTGIEDRVMTTQPKMVCLDVDGTLVDHYGHMSDTVKEAARDIVAAGHEVIVSTGRSLGATLPIVQLLGITSGYAVCSNGGLTVRIDTSVSPGYEVIDRRTFDPAPALRALRNALPTAKYALESDQGDFLATERFQDASFGVRAKAVTFEQMMEATAVRLVVFSSDDSSEDFVEAVQTIGLQGVAYSVGWTAWLDIAAEGITKASAIEALRGELGFEVQHTVAVGDGRNDIEMLGWAGRGVAMGQAPDEVKAAADEVTTTVDEDGLANVLRRLL
ncbi:HAD family hydrolase, partial [Arthrobacter sp. AOP36-A1-22]|uniref:HAD family hydrolase n=1 Tax=Arthrobacter sp. AOP36-A1-22 TaxID=3457684 RepID=UPI004034C1FA